MTSVSTRLAIATAAISLAAGSAFAQSEQDKTAKPATCLAVVLPSVQGVEGSASETASAVRELFVSFLSGPTIEPLPLESRLPSQAVLEARQKDCGQVLIASLSRKRSGGSKLAGVLGRAAENAAWRVPYDPSIGGAVASGVAIAGGQAIATLASDTRQKDELELEYRVGPAETVVNARPKSVKAKAKVDGEDLLTPLVEHASQDIASLIE